MRWLISHWHFKMERYNFDFYILLRLVWWRKNHFIRIWTPFYIQRMHVLRSRFRKQFKAIFIHKGSLEGHAKESTVIECFSCIAKPGQGVEVDVIKLGWNWLNYVQISPFFRRKLLEVYFNEYLIIVVKELDRKDFEEVPFTAFTVNEFMMF